MTRRVLHSASDLEPLLRLLGSLKFPVTVEWRQGRDRSREQNSTQWLWAAEVASQMGDRDAADVQADWKLRHGVPILRENSPEFRETYDALLKPLPYEMKLKAMRNLDFGVTRLMNVKEMVRYLDAIQRECLENGLRLTDPDPLGRVA